MFKTQLIIMILPANFGFPSALIALLRANPGKLNHAPISITLI